MNKKRHKKHIPTPKKARRRKNVFFSYGNINPKHTRILSLILAIIFISTMLVVVKAVRLQVVQEVHAAPAPPAATVSPFEKEVREMVHGYPIEKMVPYILKEDPRVAAFIISIAKKESNWGLHHPVLNGKDCYNYWGFRMKSEKMGSGGHTCFSSPKEAVETVASRIDELVNDEQIDSPKEMIVWKCGYACQEKRKRPDEIKWINDVNIYYSTITQTL